MRVFWWRTTQRADSCSACSEYLVIDELFAFRPLICFGQFDEATALVEFLRRAVGRVDAQDQFVDILVGGMNIVGEQPQSQMREASAMEAIIRRKTPDKHAVRALCVPVFVIAIIQHKEGGDFTASRNQQHRMVSIR